MRKKLFSMFALLCLTAAGAWAQTEQTVDVTPVTGQTNQWTLAMPAGNVVLHVEYEPWLITTQTNNAQWGTVEAVMGGTVEWNTDTWASWTDNTVKTHTVDGVTITAGGNASAYKYSSDDYLFIYVNSTSTNTLTFSADAPFNRIEFTKKTPSSSLYVSPLDGWSLSDDQTTVIWEGEATKSLVCETCTLSVTKIKFFCENSVTAGEAAGTYNVVAGKSITLKATPNEGYLLEGWYNGTTKIEASDAAVIDDEAGTLTLTPEGDMTISARFVEQTYTVTLTDKTYGDNAHVTATVAGTAATVTEGKLEGVKMGSEVKLEANPGYKFRKVEVKKNPVAEGHALTSAKFGEIVCSDGKAYAAADKDILPKGVKAEALVCYADGDHGLALAMVDVKDEKMSWDNDRGANDGKTAAEWCTGWNTSHPITGATWLLASKTQWDNMISAAGSASNLSNAFSAVGGTNLQAYSYWSSTPNHGGSAAWFYYFPTSSWQWTYLNQDETGRYIRACLEW